MSDDTSGHASGGDERRHMPGDERWWGELYAFDFVDAAGHVGGFLQACLYPNRGVTWVWAAVVGPARRLVALYEHEAPLPRGRSLEVRSSGLWLDLECEVPLDHFTVGLEAFALEVDDPLACFGALRGDLVPFGMDMEWESEDAPFPHQHGCRGYDLACRAHGDVLVGDEHLEVDGWGHRSHVWGVLDWWTRPWRSCRGRLGGADDGEPIIVVEGGGVEDGGVEAGAGQRQGFGYRGDPRRAHEGPGAVAVHATASRPVGAALAEVEALELGGEQVGVEPVAWAPLAVPGPDGQTGYLSRALVVLEDTDGRRGQGWLAVNEPG